MTYSELVDALRLIDLKLANAIPELEVLKPLDKMPTGGMLPGYTYAQEPWSDILERCAGKETRFSRGASFNCFGNPPSATSCMETRQKHIQQHIDKRRASMQQLLIEVAEAKKQMEALLQMPLSRMEVQVSAEWEPLAHILLSNAVFPFPAVVNSATGDMSPYAMRGHTHQTGFSNAPAYVSLLEKLRKAQEEYSEHTAPELWKIKIRLLERMCKFDSDAALAVKREQEIERMEQEAAAAERAAEQARQRAEAMRDRINSARSGGAE